MQCAAACRLLSAGGPSGDPLPASLHRLLAPPPVQVRTAAKAGDAAASTNVNLLAIASVWPLGR